MKKINIVKLILDILMCFVFVVLLDKTAFSGQGFHEVAGLLIGVAFIVHILLNGKWIIYASKNLFSRTLSMKKKVEYVVDILLFLSLATIIVTGILMSKVVFVNVVGTAHHYSVLHQAVSYLTLLLLGIHIGLHWGWVMAMFKKIFHIPQNNEALHYLTVLATVVILGFGVYNIYATNYFAQVARITAGFSQTETGGGRYGAPSREALPSEQTTSGQTPASTPTEAVTDNTSATANQTTSSGSTAVASNSTSGTTATTGSSSAADQTTASSAQLGGGNNGSAPGGRGSGQEQNGQPPEGGEGFRGGLGETPGSGNVWVTLYQNLSIMAVFAIIIYYLSKWFGGKKKKIILN